MSKAGLVGLPIPFSLRLKLKLDIKSNILIPQAVTRMTQDFGASVNQRREEQGKLKVPDARKN